MKKIVILSLVVFVAATASAQKKEKDIKRPDSYNYTRGIEEAQNDNYDEALTYLSREVADNPKNGYAYCWMAFVYLQQEEYGRALSTSDNAIKYIPKKDTHYQSVSYNYRAGIYLALADTLQALADYATAIKLSPEETESYERRGGLYYSLKEYDKSIADY